MYRAERDGEFFGAFRWGLAAFLKQLQSGGVPGFRSTSRGALIAGWGIIAVLSVPLWACSEAPTTSSRPTSLASGGVGGAAPSTTQEPTASATPTTTPTARAR